jgi:hypothetical protein
MKKFLSLALAGAAMITATNANAALTISNVTSTYGAAAPTADLSEGWNFYNNVRVSPSTITGNWDGNPVSLVAFCVDLAQGVGTGTFDVVSLLSYVGNNAAKANRIAALIDDRAGSGIMANDAAIQLAVWELMYETSNTLDVKANNFDTSDINSSFQNTANSYLSSAVANVNTIDPNLRLYVAKSSSKQDLLFYTRTPAVPEPATWGMMIAGFAAVGYSMRGRRSKMDVSFA